MAVRGGRTVWRWAVVVWLVVIAVAGGLTWRWQGSTEPQRYGWEDSAPTPSVGEQGRKECADDMPGEDGQADCLPVAR